MRTLRDIAIELLNSDDSSTKNLYWQKENLRFRFLIFATGKSINLFDSENIQDSCWCDSELNLKFNYIDFPDYSTNSNGRKAHDIHKVVYRDLIIPVIDKAKVIQEKERMEEKFPERKIKSKKAKI